MGLPRADLESLLRARRLDRTLTTVLPPIDRGAAGVGPDGDLSSFVAPSAIVRLDARLGGGFPRGQLSEVTGSRSSGRTSVLLQTLGAATARGELVALVDGLDMLDIESAAAAGVDLTRLLWVRGHMVTNPGMCLDLNQRALEQAIRAFTLILQAGNFGLVVLDLAEAPMAALRRLPFTTWLRVQRMVEGSQTVCLVVAGEPIARSSAGLTLQLAKITGSGDSGLEIGRDSGSGIGGHSASAIGRFGASLFDGLDAEARVVRARAREREDVRVHLSTTCA